MEQLTGRVVFITGAAQGIGLAIARAFTRAGARVAITDIDQKQLDVAVDQLTPLADEPTAVTSLVLDVQDRAAFAAAVDDAEGRLGPVDILCNNAGLASRTSIADLEYAVWDRVLGVNLGGVVNGIQTVLPRMLGRGGPGHIVNVASGAGLVPSDNVTYVASKYAVVGLTESLRLQPELVQAGIGVSAVCPGLVKTDVLRNSRRYVDGPVPPNDKEQALLHRYGLDPSVVGDQVLSAVRNDQLFVLTDRYIEPLLTARARTLQAALPDETDRDRDLAALLQARIADRPGAARAGRTRRP